MEVPNKLKWIELGPLTSYENHFATHINSMLFGGKAVKKAEEGRRYKNSSKMSA